MAAFTSLQIMALEAPELAGATLTKNGVALLLTEYFQGLLDTNNGVIELALAMMFRQLATEDLNESLRLGEFEFRRRTGMTFDGRRFYWEGKYRQLLIGQQGCAITMGYSYYVSNGFGYAVR